MAPQRQLVGRVVRCFIFFTLDILQLLIDFLVLFLVLHVDHLLDRKDVGH